jgi:NADH-quinone oxidoreductase subunit G
LILFGREMMLAQQREPAVVSALATLLLITNHIGRANSGLIALYPHNNSMGALDMGVVSDKSYSAAELLSAKTRVLWVMGADPAAHGKFSKPNLLIVQDLWTTATARLADVILPAQSFAEREGTFTNTERRVQLFRAALPPRGDAQADWWIIARLAKELGADWDYASPVQIMEEISARVPQYAGITYDQLARVDVPEYISKPVTGVEPELLAGQGAPREDSVRIAMGEPTGATSSIQWATVAESNPDAKFAIQWIEPAAPAPGEGLVLAVARSLYDRGNLVNETRLIQSRVPKPYVEINNPHTFLSGVVNAHDAEELALADGATVRVSFDTRKMDLPARVNGHVPPGVVLIPSFLDGTERLEAGVTVKVEVLQK